MLTATGFTIGAVTCGGFPHVSHDRLAYVVSSAIWNAAHVHAVTAKGRRYFYDRRTRQRLTEDEVSEVWSERKLNKNCKTAVKLPNRSKRSKSDSSMISSGWGTRNSNLD